MGSARFTPGPWSVWDGPGYVGGGRDLCIGAGEKWLANMDHREPRCPRIMEDGHDGDACDICTLDASHITEEQAANARLIAAAPALYEALENLTSLVGEADATSDEVLRACAAALDVLEGARGKGGARVGA